MISSVYQITLLIDMIAHAGKYNLSPGVEDELVTIFCDVLLAYLVPMSKDSDFSMNAVDRITEILDREGSLLSIADSAEEYKSTFDSFPGQAQIVTAIKNQMYVLASDITVSGKKALTKQTLALLQSFEISDDVARKLALNASVVINELLYFANNALEASGDGKYISVYELKHVYAADGGSFSRFENTD